MIVIYLDNASTTKISKAVLDEMMPYLEENYANPSSVHAFGRDARDAVEHAREQAANFFRTTPDKIIFTSSGSEANALALHAAMRAMITKGKFHIVASAVEHHSVMSNLEDAGSGVFYVEYVYPDENGVITADSVREKISDDTGLVCVMYANNETGVINEVEQIGELCKENGVMFFTDCVHAAGIVDIDVGSIHCDFATMSAHKIHGPKGVGVLYTRLCDFTPMIFGGADQEHGVRGGTENVAGIVGAGYAMDIARADLKHIDVKMKLLKKVFCDALFDALNEKNISDAVKINFSSDRWSGKIISITMNGCDAETVVLAMSSLGVYVSAGAACNSNDSVASYVLRSCGMSDDEARRTIRVSFSKMNSTSDARDAGKTLADVIGILNSGKSV